MQAWCNRTKDLVQSNQGFGAIQVKDLVQSELISPINLYIFSGEAVGEPFCLIKPHEARSKRRRH